MWNRIASEQCNKQGGAKDRFQSHQTSLPEQAPSHREIRCVMSYCDSANASVNFLCISALKIAGDGVRINCWKEDYFFVDIGIYYVQYMSLFRLNTHKC